MELKGFIIGLVILIISLGLCITFVIDLYSEDGYDIDLSADKNTKTLYNISQNTESYSSSVSSSTKGIYDGLPGESGASFDPEGTESQLQLGALSALTQMKGMLSIFTQMLISLFGLLGLSVSATEAYLWFFSVIIIVPLALILLSSVLQNPVR